VVVVVSTRAPPPPPYLTSCLVVSSKAPEGPAVVVVVGDGEDASENDSARLINLELCLDIPLSPLGRERGRTFIRVTSALK